MTSAWRRPMGSRNSSEEHRASTPLELLYDLCFVVAVSRASSLLHHAISHGDAGHAVVSYVLVFFGIWWAWMNFTWFASAYDNDDALYRVLVFVQMAGVLLLAAGVPRAFEHRDFDVVLAGYLVMRAALATLWLRAAHYDSSRRGTDRRYAAGVSLCMIGWAAVGIVGWPVWAFVLMGAVELVVPMWAEAVEPTTWHPEHIAERYGLFTIIVLGEAILSSSIAFQAVVDARNVDLAAVLTAVGALLTVFAMWWIYFAKPAAPRLSNRVAFPWGYGHYVVLAAAAAVGTGVGVMVDRVTGRTHLSDVAAAAAFTVPVILFLLAVAFIQTLLDGVHRDRLGALLIAVVLVAGATFTGQPVLVTGLALAALVAALVVLAERSAPVRE
jgi:low temperature requirement protein LtrA